MVDMRSVFIWGCRRLIEGIEYIDSMQTLSVTELGPTLDTVYTPQYANHK